tara:strand:+ start:132 stop:533 length:402 start_codon:yes stop_codon:yes gene_type:complete
MISLRGIEVSSVEQHRQHLTLELELEMVEELELEEELESSESEFSVMMVDCEMGCFSVFCEMVAFFEATTFLFTSFWKTEFFELVFFLLSFLLGELIWCTLRFPFAPGGVEADSSVESNFAEGCRERGISMMN